MGAAEQLDPMDPGHPKKGFARQCSAHNRQGNRCGRRPRPGSTVCVMHGGAAPQVQNAARRRLLEAADPAAAELVKLLDSPDEQIRLRAATALLDRSGHGASSTQVQVDGGQVDYRIDGVDLEAL